MTTDHAIDTSFLKSKASKSLIYLNILLALIYTTGIVFFFPHGNLFLFAILVITQLYYLWIGLTFSYTILETEAPLPTFDEQLTPNVDVFITVAGEPSEIVRETALAAKNMDYPSFKVYLLNDGYVAQKPNWSEAQEIAKELGIGCFTRVTPGGAKAGNINNALQKTDAPLVVIFDADHVPHPDFLKKTVGYFTDPKMGFVQTPQYYKNYDLNDVTLSSWEQQELYFGAICKGKNRMNSVSLCGTNMVISRKALEEVGGMEESNIAEDFLTSLFIHNKGWKSVYVPEVLAEGLAPEDFGSYYKQQLRWARGSLEVLIKHNPLFQSGLSWKQRIQYLSSASYYLSGIIVLLNILLPLIFFVTGLVPLTISSMTLAAIFIIYIFTSVYTLSLSTNETYTTRAVAFSLGSFTIFLQALFMVLFNVKQGFAITEKRAVEGNFANFVIPHILYLGLTIAGGAYAIIRFGMISSVITNISWAVFHSVIFAFFISAAMPRSWSESRKEIYGISQA